MYDILVCELLRIFEEGTEGNKGVKKTEMLKDGLSGLSVAGRPREWHDNINQQILGLTSIGCSGRSVHPRTQEWLGNHLDPGFKHWNYMKVTTIN